MVIKHNMQAMNASRNLGVVTGKQAGATEKLSSGYKINRAADDASGLSISEKMRRQVRGLTQASANAQDGISYVQVAEGALNEVHDMLQRCNELAVKAGNDTNTPQDRAFIHQEIKQLHAEIDRIASTTTFNELKVFNSQKAEKLPEVDIKSITLASDYMTYNMQDFSGAISGAAAVGKTFTQDGLADFANAIKDTYMPKLLGDIVSALPKSAIPTVAGMQIGLKMEYTNDNTLAYVSSNGTGFLLGINLKYLTENAGKIDMTPDLATTIAHEMTHAVMFDITTNGLLGTGGADRFPSWFIEGTAQAVGGAINYCDELTYVVMSQGDKAISDWLSELTDTTDSYNAYAQGYIASMYLGYIAGGGGAVNASTISSGLDDILRDVSNGYSLGEAIYRCTDGQYAGLADFENNFPTDAVSFTKNLIKAIGSGTGSIASPSGLTGDKSSLLNGSSTSNYFVLNVDESNLHQNNMGSKNPYEGGGATTTNGSTHDGGVNKDASPVWDESKAVKWNAHAADIELQVGAEPGQHIAISGFALSCKDLGIYGVKVDSMEHAGEAINSYKGAIEQVSEMRSYYGAIQNRLEHTIANLDNIVENTQAAESQIRDTDIAAMMVQYSNYNILMQTGTSMLAQANQGQQSVLSLLSA